MYLENSAGYSRVYDTISVNNFGHGGQFFGVTGPYIGGDVQGSVFANAGSPMRGIDPNIAYRNMLSVRTARSFQRQASRIHTSTILRGWAIQ